MLISVVLTGLSVLLLFFVVAFLGVSFGSF